MNFVSGASPEVVTAMSSAVQSLLGGLGYSAGGTGIEVIVKANGERLGNLCFQLQMTGYMVRTYVRLRGGRDNFCLESTDWCRVYTVLISFFHVSIDSCIYSFYFY